MIHLYRNMERSVYYWLKDIFSTANFIKVVDSFPDENLTLPTIAVEKEELSLESLELGTRKLKDLTFNFRIDIFTENKSQRDDYAYLILDNLEERIPVYDYSNGFPPSVSPQQIGVLIPLSIRFVPIKVFPELTSKLYWRGQIYFSAGYESMV